MMKEMTDSSISDALCNLVIERQPLSDWDAHNAQLDEGHVDQFMQTRSSRTKQLQPTSKGRIRQTQQSVTVDPITNLRTGARYYGGSTVVPVVVPVFWSLLPTGYLTNFLYELKGDLKWYE